jgi:formylglycine-generating enzyme required for sulfatase activity
VPTAPLASSARWGSGSFLAALVGLALGGQFAFGGWRFWEMPPRTQLKWAVRANLFGALLAGAPALVGLAEPISQRLLAWSAGLGVSPWMAALALGALAGLVSYWPLRGAELGAKFACQPLLRGRTQVHLFMARRHLARRRETEAAQWFVKAANAGNAEAQYQMGSMYETGRGVATNNQVAFTWYLAAARQSSAPAKLKLVEMYQQGRGVARNWEEAWKWREREAEHRSSGGPLFRAVVAAAVLVVFGAIAIVANLLSGGSHGEPRVEKKAPLVHATPAPARALTPTPSVPEADVPFVNSLGMKFLHVPTARGSRVLFSVWETRVQDYEAFASETRRTWQKPSFPQGPTHPAVNVTWQDAVAFCAWLSKKEGRTYRLPTDAEWSEAVGLPVETGGTPEEKNANSAGGYPWGKEFPPPQGAGNYGSSLKVDSFENTAPVASFGPNALGLYDLSGNVWEWCEDWVRGKFDFRVVRGGSWDDAGTSLRSSWRGYAQPSSSSERLGFRCVLVSQTPGPAAAQPIALPLRIPSVIVIPPPKPSPPKTARAELPAPSPADQPSPTDPRNPPTFTNSLGQKFVSVPNTAVLFCLWPTRVQDFAVFAKETAFRNYSWKNPGFKQDPDHPVVNVTWNDAVAFCKWLTDRDRKKGFLSKDQLYRLPTDLEWSKAVGLAEETGQTPEARDMAVPDVFPWGTQWPPPPNVGNYSGEETGSDVAIKGYDDGFAWTSPVGTFPANKYGLYDVGGNVWQWCMDNSTNESKTKVLRGGSWYNGALRLSLLSSCRVSANPDSSTDNYGFRIVRAPVNPQAAARPSSQGGLAPAPISTPRLATPAKKAASATPKPR